MNKAKKATGITAWPKDDRPRERLLKNGAATLKDAELIAIILRVGVQGMSAVEMGQALIQKFGSLKMMTEATADALGEIKGIKNAKIAQLLAVMEIARRAGAEGAIERQRIGSTADAKKYFRQRLRSLPEEHFRVLYLNRQKRYFARHAYRAGRYGFSVGVIAADCHSRFTNQCQRLDCGA